MLILTDMKTRTPEMERAAARLAGAVRWKGPDSPEADAARRELAEAKLARAQAEADKLQRELDETAAAS